MRELQSGVRAAEGRVVAAAPVADAGTAPVPGLRPRVPDPPLRAPIARPRAADPSDELAHLRSLAPEGDEASNHREIVRRDTAFRRALGLADLLGAGAALLVAQLATATEAFPVLGYLGIPLVLLVSKAFGLYDRDELVIAKTTLAEAPAVFQLATLSTLLITILIAATPTPLDPITIAVVWAVLLVGVLCNRALARVLVRALTDPERCLVLGTSTQGAQMLSTFTTHDGSHAEIVAYLPFAEFELNRPRRGRFASYVAARGIERVIIAYNESSDHVHQAVRYFKAHHLKVSVLPNLLEVIGSSVEFDELHGTTLLGVKSFGLSRSSVLLKRGFDLAVAAALTVALSPLLLLLAVAVRLETPGPALFRQARVGRGGHPFTMYKFRTMVDGAERQRAEVDDLNETSGLFKAASDPRVTRVGAFLRRTSLDELPQLLNVLRGQMSLVGPRPLILEEDARVEGWHRDRLSLKPGMTGAWQVIGSVRVPLEDMAVMDYLYIVNWSPWSDAKILLQTVRHVVGARGL